MNKISTYFRRPTLWVFLISLVASWQIHQNIKPVYSVEKIPLEVSKDTDGYYYLVEDKRHYILPKNVVALEDSSLSPAAIEKVNADNTQKSTKDFPSESQIVYQLLPVEKSTSDLIKPKKKRQYYRLQLKKHYGIYSLLPALVAIAFCWLSHEPISSLFLASLSGAIILGHFDFLNQVIAPALTSKSAIMVLILYLWLLGGLLGIWSRTGGARAFADWVSRHFVRGPVSARLVAWSLGLLFFQGGTISTVLVGTTVKPLADKQKVSHEELSYIVDSTASPIACLLAFNAWPAYIQGFLYLPGVAFLATEKERLFFFFQSLPFSFYALLAVIGTFLFCFDKLPLIGSRMHKARQRARSQGQLDGPWARPLSAKEVYEANVPENYRPHPIEFVLPLICLLAIAIISFIITGTPEVHLAFAVALCLAIATALLRGMTLKDLVSGLESGYRSVITGASILMLAIIVGGITREAGGGLYLVELLQDSIPFWLLPSLLLALTIVISFSTGTSWGTYAVVYPLAMPLAWAMGVELTHPQLFLSLCFAVVLNGSVIGDQSSPISDTTILTSMCTGCDLMDHVRTQIVPVAWLTTISTILWTIAALLCI